MTRSGHALHPDPAEGDAAVAPGRSRARRLKPGRRTSVVARHVLLAFATLLAISIITFAATNIKSPTDVARNALGRFVGPVALHRYVQSHGLNDPVYERYVRWFGGYVRGDWGVSPTTNERVEPVVLRRAERTALLTLGALLLATPLGILIGAYSARHPASRRDFAIVIVAIAFAALPEFVIGIVLLLVFAVNLQLLPADSTAISFGGVWGQSQDYVLPVITLVIAILPYITRMARVSFHETYRSAYVQSAVLRGLPRRTVIWRHAFPNAAITLVNVVAQNLIYVFGGVIVVESVFGLPGIGSTLVEAIGSGDVITVQAIAMLTGIVFVIVNLTADVIVLLLNPKLRTRA